LVVAGLRLSDVVDGGANERARDPVQFSD